MRPGRRPSRLGSPDHTIDIGLSHLVHGAFLSLQADMAIHESNSPCCFPHFSLLVSPLLSVNPALRPGTRQPVRQQQSLLARPVSLAMHTNDKCNLAYGNRDADYQPSPEKTQRASAAQSKLAHFFPSDTERAHVSNYLVTRCQTLVCSSTLPSALARL